MSAVDRLKQLGLELPAPATPVGSYVPAIRSGDHIMTSGQLPMVAGTLVCAGKVPADVALEQAQEAARIAVLNALAAVADLAGGLDRIERVIRLAVYVNSSPGFTAQASVADGASDLLVKLFGEAGRHVRCAVGVAELPLGAPVELELTAALR